MRRGDNMKKIKKILSYIGAIAILIIFIAIMILFIWVRIEFAETPLSDIPGWALPFMK